MIVRLHPRRGVATLEAAIAFPVLAFLVLALAVGAMGVFRYQEACYVAHEAARYASVHGTDYEKDSGQPAATTQTIYDNAIKPRLMTLDPARVTYSVTWDKNNTPYSIVADYEKPVTNTVTVTVTYSWLPELYIVGPLPLTGKCTRPMAY